MSQPASLVVCHCRSSRCFEETHRSEHGIIKRGTLVSRRTLRHHRYRDNDLMLNEVGDNPGHVGPSPAPNALTDDARAQNTSSGKRAMLDYVVSALDYSVPLEFCHPPTGSRSESRPDCSNYSDEAGLYKLLRTPANFGFLETWAVVNRLLSVPRNSPLRHDAEVLSRTLSDWKAREWHRQRESVHMCAVMRASGISIYDNSMILFALVDYY